MNDGNYYDETLMQRAIATQYQLIQEHANRSEKRTSAILKIVIENPECFYLIHSVVDFNLISRNFMRELTEVVSEFLFFKKTWNITMSHLQVEYTQACLQLIQFQKEIKNEIILNALKYLEKTEQDIIKEELTETNIAINELKNEHEGLQN